MKKKINEIINTLETIKNMLELLIKELRKLFKK